MTADHTGRCCNKLNHGLVRNANRIFLDSTKNAVADRAYSSPIRLFQQPVSGCFATLLTTPALARRPSLERRGFAHKVDEMDIPLLSKEGKFAKRTGWLLKSRSHLIDDREAHLIEKRTLRDFINHPGADAPPLLGKEGNNYQMSISTTLCAKPKGGEFRSIRRRATAPTQAGRLPRVPDFMNVFLTQDTNEATPQTNKACGVLFKDGCGCFVGLRRSLN